MLHHSVSGGTGSGVGAMLTHDIMVEYEKKDAFNFCIFPSKSMSNETIEPYNAIFGSSYLIDNSKLIIPVSN